MTNLRRKLTMTTLVLSFVGGILGSVVSAGVFFTLGLISILWCIWDDSL